MHIVWAVSRNEAKPATPGFDVTGLGREGFIPAPLAGHDDQLAIRVDVLDA